uniref:Uncharacterized protein n=1 Tax=Chromera velia CCMP2878 TaxID=1169474 RepID=A0A0G4HH27_9ALVE|eukprot:Cvel_6814.t1-p1 / transcript=Cvel_6814.t1 / gene=Cvel_6814 / organism=Chromera_velia_CCMP2878 / gene_product=hypothetical protein / transcript_product=hypothetical protein / location=Cvel_scaffold343:46409-47978(-) / protein_length=424 / sequence_SO=supercontig / SO=protein_coding / is_pseudo=false
MKVRPALPTFTQTLHSHGAPRSTTAQSRVSTHQNPHPPAAFRAQSTLPQRPSMTPHSPHSDLNNSLRDPPTWCSLRAPTTATPHTARTQASLTHVTRLFCPTARCSTAGRPHPQPDISQTLHALPTWRPPPAPHAIINLNQSSNGEALREYISTAACPPASLQNHKPKVQSAKLEPKTLLSDNTKDQILSDDSSEDRDKEPQTAEEPEVPADSDQTFIEGFTSTCWPPGSSLFSDLSHDTQAQRLKRWLQRKESGRRTDTSETKRQREIKTMLSRMPSRPAVEPISLEEIFYAGSFPRDQRPFSFHHSEEDLMKQIHENFKKGMIRADAHRRAEQLDKEEKEQEEKNAVTEECESKRAEVVEASWEVLKRNVQIALKLQEMRKKRIAHLQKGKGKELEKLFAPSKSMKEVINRIKREKGEGMEA